MAEQNIQKRFLLGKEPFIRKADSIKYGTDVIMRDFFIALIPLILFAWIKNGLMPYIAKDTTSFWIMIKPLCFIFIGGFTSWLLEFISYKYFLKEKDVFNKLKHSFAIIPGVLLAMILSLNTPIWVLIIGCFFATIIGKVLFGGFGNNVFNPALVGYLFISVAYYSTIVKNGGFSNPSEIDILAGATPLTNFKSNPVAPIESIISPYGNLWDFLIGTVPGSLAETSALLCLFSYVYLSIRKVINWKVPLIYVATVFVLTYIIGATNGYATDLRYPLFNILSGGLLFGAVFMATEPVTSPKSPNGKIVFALSLGVLTVLFRYKGNMPEGVATALITMNLFTIIIDRVCAKIRVEDKKVKVAVSYSIIGLLLIAISAYVITSFANTVSFSPEDAKIESVSEQNLSTKEFTYTFVIGNERVNVSVDVDQNITSIDNDKYENNEFIEAYESKINEYITDNGRVYPYLKVVEDNDDTTTLTIIGKRKGSYSKEVTITITIKDEVITSFVSDSKKVESYTNEGYVDWSGIHPEDVIPNKIIDNQNNIDDIEIVATATQTSNLLLDAGRLAVRYIEEVLD